jgi:hypothetical protein
MTVTLENVREYLFAEPDTNTWRDGDTFVDVISKNLDQPWDYWLLSDYVTWDFIDNNIHHGWNWDELSGRLDLDFEVVRRHSEKDWNWRVLSEHPCVTLDMIRKYPNHFWNFTKREVPFDILKRCPLYMENLHAISGTIPLETIMESPDEKWDWVAVTKRKDITIGLIETHMDYPWKWELVIARDDFTWDMVKRHPGHDWPYYSLSHQRGVRWDVIEMLIDKPWDFDTLSRNVNIPFELVKRTPHKWNILHVVRYSGVPEWEFMAISPNTRWNYKSMSARVPWDVVLKLVNHPWNWKTLSTRNDLPLRALASRANLPWVWHHISKHPLVTADFVANHFWLPWVKQIVQSRFDKELAAIKIQRWWLRLYYTPTSDVCLRRLMRDCAELNNLAACRHNSSS